MKPLTPEWFALAGLQQWERKHPVRRLVVRDGYVVYEDTGDRRIPQRVMPVQADLWEVDDGRG